MKKILLLAVACLISVCGFSQSRYRSDEKLDKLVLAVNLTGPDMVTQELQLELKLDDDQHKQVLELNLFRYNEIMTAEEVYQNDPVILSRVIRNINFENDKAITKLLSEVQMQAFLKLDEQRNMILVSENE
ncbi:hypothetical protein ACFSKU_03925 [Pontibacter silvestris]|uniref:Uncharacterized protein n=1 Tax=Pontibacter silvestris TaxID=2305183 RepID=A0ABW4WTE7_9BACT|nr:hypothetical protein [Pontibacter silvestris]MCC9137990.1 hypothetical protein [Pontibacter silvestris]